MSEDELIKHLEKVLKAHNPIELPYIKEVSPGIFEVFDGETILLCGKKMADEIKENLKNG